MYRKNRFINTACVLRLKFYGFIVGLLILLLKLLSVQVLENQLLGT